MVNPAGPVGVLAVQGDFAAHCRAVERAGYRAVEVRRAGKIPEMAALVLPGGESTTMLKFLRSEGLDEAVGEFVHQGGPVLATCAGVILLAKEVENPCQDSLGLMDLGVTRIGYGRQVYSAIHQIVGPKGLESLEAVFIRAPRILRVGKEVQVLARFGEDPVMVRQGSMVGITFHPELVKESGIHAWFLEEVAQLKS